MAMKYYSEQLNRLFDTVEELEAAEAKQREEEEKALAAKRAEEEKKAQLKAKREERAKEVEEAFKIANEETKKAYALLNAFVKDFGSFHTTIRDTGFSDIFNQWFGKLF